MANILILYATYDGTTQQVAERLGAAVARAGHEPKLVNVLADKPGREAFDGADAVIAGAAIRYGHHDRQFEAFVKANREALGARPNAFFSVCMSAGGPGARPATAAKYIEDFTQATGWTPQRSRSFAGACLFTRYPLWMKLMMRLIMGMAGGETDTKRDYRYTDFGEVERWGTEFANTLQPEALRA